MHPARTYPRALALIAAGLASACTADRAVVNPNPLGIPDHVQRQIEAATDTSGMVAVALGADSTGAPVYVIGSVLQTTADGVEAVIPSGDERNAFIVHPNGGRNTGNGNHESWNRHAIPGLNPVTERQGFAFYCNGRQVTGVRVDSVVQRDSERPSGSHGSRHAPVSKPYGRWLTRSGATGTDGWFWSQYESNIASGDERILVYFVDTNPSSPCRGGRLTGVWRAAVSLRGLVPLQRNNGKYNFGAVTSDHAEIFYMQPGYQAKTNATADFYRESFGGTLTVNAGSLPFGGIADVNRNWNPPHSTHRIGTDLDIDGGADNARVFQRLILAGERGGGFAKCEPHNGNHVHCYGRRYGR